MVTQVVRRLGVAVGSITVAYLALALAAPAFLPMIGWVTSTADGSNPLVGGVELLAAVGVGGLIYRAILLRESSSV